MSELVLSTTAEIMKELEGRFETMVLVGVLPSLNENADRPMEEAEVAQYRVVKGDASELNLWLDVIKLEVLGTFIESGREPEAWER